MPGKVAILDTSLMCCWIEVPGFETAGSGSDRWDKVRTSAAIESAIDEGFTLVLPITTVIETGNHISHAVSGRYDKANEFFELIAKAFNGTEPWTTFSDQASSIFGHDLIECMRNWPEAAARGVSVGDQLIVSVADYYSRASFTVRILSSDGQLAAHEPEPPPSIPRRRR